MFKAPIAIARLATPHPEDATDFLSPPIVQIVSRCSPWLIYHEGLPPLCVLPFDEPDDDLFILPIQHLKSLPPGHFPLIFSPLH